MSVPLQRFVRPARPGEIAVFREDPTALETETVAGVEVDLSGVREVFERFAAKFPNASSRERALLDSELVEPLHQAVPLTPRDAGDMRIWHWLCLSELFDLVSWRWSGSRSLPSEERVGGALAGRFLGSNTLHGVSRNALARVWWCGESLHSEHDGYTLARDVLSNQDLFQNIYERYFGLYPPAARAFIRKYRGTPEKEFRDGAKRLNHYLTTIVLETLSEEDVTELMSA
jgi:hypothetical protein